MDTGKFRKLNGFHVVFLPQNIMVGIGIYSLAHNLSSVGYDQWLVVPVLGIIATLTLWPIIKLCEAYPDDTIFKINERILGKWIGKMFNMLLITYSILQVSAINQTYLRLVQTVTLPEYSTFPTSLMLFFVMVCIVLGGIKSIARFCILSFFFTVWMLYFVRWALFSAEWLHLVPTFQFGVNDLFEALYGGSLSMLGYGLILVYYPYIINRQKAFIHSAIGMWISITIYFIISASSVAYFSVWQLENVKFPVLNLLQAVQLTFVERIENFGTTLWIFLVLSTSSAYLWVAKKGFDALFSDNRNRTWHVFAVAFIGLFLFQGPIPDRVQIRLFEQWNVYLGYVTILLPILLLLLNKIKQRGKRNDA